MLFQGPSILKFSCASGANNQSHQFRRLDPRFIIATSETILNIVKNFVRKYSKLFGNFSTAPPPFIRRSLWPCVPLILVWTTYGLLQRVVAMFVKSKQ